MCEGPGGELHVCVRGRGGSYMCVCEGPGGELHVCV